MVVSVFSDIEDLPTSLLERISYDRQGGLFAGVEWFRCLCRHARPEGLVPRIYVATDGAGGDSACVLYCFADPRRHELGSMTTFYSMEYQPVGVGADAAALLKDIFLYIAGERPRWSKLNFRMIADAEARAGLVAAIRGCGFSAGSYFQFDNFYERGVDGAFEPYYQARPSRTRNTIRRKERKLQAEHECRTDCNNTYDQAFLDAYEHIYAASWKSAEEFPDFIPAMCRMAAGLGLLRTGVLYVDQQPAAAQLWLLSGRKAIIYKLAHDEAFKHYSVGSILTRDMMKYVIENDAVAELDYGVGSEAYKRDWMSQRREVWGIQGFNLRTPRGVTAALKSWLVDLAHGQGGVAGRADDAANSS